MAKPKKASIDGFMSEIYTDIKWIRSSLETNSDELKDHRRSLTAHGVGGTVKIMTVASILTGIAFTIWKMLA